MIWASVMLAVLNLWPTLPSQGRAAVHPGERAGVPLRSAAAARAFDPLGAVARALGPRRDVIDCAAHFRQAMASCDGKGACQARAIDQADLCDARGMWRLD